MEPRSKRGSRRITFFFFSTGMLFVAKRITKARQKIRGNFLDGLNRVKSVNRWGRGYDGSGIRENCLDGLNREWLTSIGDCLKALSLFGDLVTNTINPWRDRVVCIHHVETYYIEDTLSQFSNISFNALMSKERKGDGRMGYELLERRWRFLTKNKMEWYKRTEKLDGCVDWNIDRGCIFLVL